MIILRYLLMPWWPLPKKYGIRSLNIRGIILVCWGIILARLLSRVFRGIVLGILWSGSKFKPKLILIYSRNIFMKATRKSSARKPYSLTSHSLIKQSYSKTSLKCSSECNAAFIARHSVQYATSSLTNTMARQSYSIADTYSTRIASIRIKMGKIIVGSVCIVTRFKLWLIILKSTL